MTFKIKGKIALISGGASGIGFKYAQELLRNGLKGLTLADVNSEFGAKALEEITNEFGPNKAIYVKTDVACQPSFEDAFKKTIEVFKNLDILINNAGIFNDANWEKATAINFHGVMHGTLLGLENYIQKYKSGTEGVIVNIASTAGVDPFFVTPIYTATKFAVVGMSQAFGHQYHYNRTKVRVLTLCPGLTDTRIATHTETTGKFLGNAYEDILQSVLVNVPIQKAECVAKDMVKIIEAAPSGTVWVSQSGLELYEYIRTPRKSSQ